MKTQVLVHQMERKYVGVDAGSQIVVKGFGKADAFDAYDMTVVDLQSSEIWRNKGNSTGEINVAADISTIGTMMRKSSKCKFVVLLPQNIRFRYSYQYVENGKDYVSNKPIKDALPDLIRAILPRLLPAPISMTYGHSETVIDERIFQADFSLNPDEMSTDCEAVHVSKAQTVTTVALGERTWVLTLAIANIVELSCCRIAPLDQLEQEGDVDVVHVLGEPFVQDQDFVACVLLQDLGVRPLGGGELVALHQQVGKSHIPGAPALPAGLFGQAASKVAFALM